MTASIPVASSTASTGAAQNPHIEHGIHSRKLRRRHLIPAPTTRNLTRKSIMATITIKDLCMDRTLDRKAMSSIKGASASWVFGWISPYVDASRKAASVMNFYQTNNIFIADQMNNQIQTIDVNNASSNATINIAPSQTAANFKQ
jgi:hypothetical protein